MFKQINLRGISRTPSDRATADGGCAESLNVYLDGNEVAPALQPEIVCDQYGALAFEGRPVFIHKGKGYNNLILLSYSPRKLVARAKGAAMDSESQAVMTMRSGETLTDITAVGNTLIVCTSLRMEYVLYKDGEYKDLGDRIPVPNVRFYSLNQRQVPAAQVITPVESTTRRVAATDLTSRLCKLNASYTMPDKEDRSSASSHTGGNSTNRRRQVSSNIYERLGYTERESDADIEKALRATLWEEINAGIAIVKKQGSMCTPVFVRAALKLYDNSYIYQTVPVLLGGNMEDFFSAAFLANKQSSGDKWDSWISIEFLNAYLPYAKLDTYDYEGWEDIITSIDLFMSTDIHCPRIDSKWAQLVESEDTSTRVRYDISFHSEDTEDAAEKALNEVLSKRVFYKVVSFSPKKFSRLTDGYMMLSDEDIRSQDYLVTQSTLPDDYQSFHKKTGESTFQYNNRVIISGIRNEIYSGYPFLNGEVLMGGGEGEPVLSLQTEWRYEMCFYLKGGGNRTLIVYGRNTDGGVRFAPLSIEATYWTRSSETSNSGTTQTVTEYGRSFAWLAYPDSRCYKVDLKMFKYEGGVLDGVFTSSYEMTPHPGLNCSYVFVGFGKRIGFDGADYSLANWPTTEVKTYEERNVLWAAKMNNPFVWPKEGRLTFSADVLAMAAATKALSEGQIGQFPLMVFTKDGTWSIPITSEGDFGNVWPLTNDVLTSPSAVIGIEQAVIFVTNQGVMMLSGSDITPLSPHMNGEHFVPDEEMKALLSADENLAEYVNAYSDKTDFVKFVSEASIAYDYTGRRLIFFRTDKGYQYIYELQSATWHKLCFSKDEWISGKINSYPDCMLSTSKINTYLTKNPTNGETSLIVRMGEEVLSSNMAGNRILNVGQSQPVEILGAPITVTLGFVYDTNGTLVNGAYVEYLCTVLEAEGLPYQYYHELYLHSSEPVDGYCDIHVVVNGTNAAGMAVKDDKVIRLNLTSDASEVVEDVHSVDALYDFSVVFDSSRQQPSSPIFHDEQKALPGLIITRPFSLDNDDIRKSINKVFIRGKKNRDDVKYLLYGSMDGLSWQRLRSLRGGSYKWFRMVIISNLSPAERISWVDIEFETRFTNRMR